MKRPKANKTSKKVLDRVDDFRLKHKGLFVLIVIGLTVLVFGSLLKFGSYQSKFSDKDYAALETAAERVFKNVGAGDVERYEYCRYVAPEKYSSIGLYCGVEMVAYLSYKNDENATSVAKAFDREIKTLGTTTSDIPTIFEQPEDAMAGAAVNLLPPLPKEQCTFAIATHARAKNLANSLPRNNKDDLIALSFDCSAASREEYFPVVYQQGQ